MNEDNSSDEYLQINQKRWDELAGHHFSNSSYDIEGFRNGKSTLNHIERDLLGDLNGKKILHLQCHFGMDSISMIYEGAEEVVGIDFSGEAIKLATQLAEELEVNARFIQANILELDKYLDEVGEFDIVFTSYGTIVWLPELVSWGKMISLYLKPMGKFLIVDSHPFSNIFDDETDERRLIPRYKYFNNHEPDHFTVEGSYATNAQLSNKEEYIWAHPLSEIINSLTRQGLIIDQLEEFPFINWQMLPFLEKSKDGWYYYPEDWSFPKIPLCFALVAHQSSYNLV